MQNDCRSSLDPKVFHTKNIDLPLELPRFQGLLFSQMIPQQQQGSVTLARQILGNRKVHRAGIYEFPDAFVDVVADYMNFAGSSGPLDRGAAARNAEVGHVDSP